MAPTPPVDTGATPTRTPASVGFGPAVAVRVNLLWTATDTLLRADTLRVSVAVTVGLKRPARGEGWVGGKVFCRAPSPKGPLAGAGPNTTGCRSSKVDQSTNLSQIRTGIGHNGKLRIDCYRDVSGRCHVDSIS